MDVQDDCLALARVTTSQPSEATNNNCPNVRFNVIKNQDGDKMYILCMSNNLLSKAANFYKPYLAVNYERESDRGIWYFIHNTNKLCEL
uniref:Wsv324-like protein n=1 Tax=Pasiphaea japonica whispovirus TaxID=2984286 RepID=A0A9C7BP42_9VIRU|nr:MAG: wsv324-like protein [Pasiphaea japonica whispovirus]